MQEGQALLSTTNKIFLFIALCLVVIALLFPYTRGGFAVTTTLDDRQVVISWADFDSSKLSISHYEVRVRDANGFYA